MVLSFGGVGKSEVWCSDVTGEGVKILKVVSWYLYFVMNIPPFSLFSDDNSHVPGSPYCPLRRHPPLTVIRCRLSSSGDAAVSVDCSNEYADGCKHPQDNRHYSPAVSRPGQGWLGED